MNDHFASLEAEGKIERVAAGLSDVENQRAIATRDLTTAEGLRDEDKDNALSITYNALRAACAAVMAAYGYRAKGEDRHRTLIEFARTAAPEFEDSLNLVDRLRRQRHRVEYDAAGRVTQKEVDDALELARNLIPALIRVALAQLERRRAGGS